MFQAANRVQEDRESSVGSIFISLTVLGLSTGLALFLKRQRVIDANFWGYCVLFGPILFFWIVGASSERSTLASYSCFSGYSVLPSGLLVDAIGNSTTKFSVAIECGFGFLVLIAFELFAGAWFFTVPTGVKMVFSSMLG